MSRFDDRIDRLIVKSAFVSAAILTPTAGITGLTFLLLIPFLIAVMGLILIWEKPVYE